MRTVRTYVLSIRASSYANFKRALATNDFLLIRTAAAELPGVNLHDALEILPIIATAEPMTYEPRSVPMASTLRARNGCGPGAT